MTTISEQIVRNPEGGTVDMDGYPLPPDGFFVGGAGTVLIFRSHQEIDKSLISLWLTRPPVAACVYVGWWTDQETGKVYVDWSSWTLDRPQAEFLAATRGEIAFWDIRYSESVKV